MSNEDDGEKQYEPTQKRLDEARKRGEIPSSTDLTTALSYSGILLSLLVFGAGMIQTIGSTLAALLSRADHLSTAMFNGGSAPVMIQFSAPILGALAVLLGVPACFALLGLIAQRGIVFAPDKITPKLSRLSPLANAKNKFGRSGLFEFAKSASKLIILCVILAIYLSARFDQLIGTMMFDAGQIATEMAGLVIELMTVVVVASLSIGGGDLLWQHAEHRRKNMMSREDLKQETKQSEGDPAMKQQRRQRGYDIAMNKMLVETATADVVIVNPTHYAVALKWDSTSGQPPIVVAKGMDEIAARIRQVANENAVPIRSDPPTARAIHASCEIGDPIRPDQYRAVAAAIRFAEMIRKKARR